MCFGGEGRLGVRLRRARGLMGSDAIFPSSLPMRPRVYPPIFSHPQDWVRVWDQYKIMELLTYPSLTNPTLTLIPYFGIKCWIWGGVEGWQIP